MKLERIDKDKAGNPVAVISEITAVVVENIIDAVSKDPAVMDYMNKEQSVLVKREIRKFFHIVWRELRPS